MQATLLFGALFLSVSSCWSLWKGEEYISTLLSRKRDTGRLDSSRVYDLVVAGQNREIVVPNVNFLTVATNAAVEIRFRQPGYIRKYLGEVATIKSVSLRFRTEKYEFIPLQRNPFRKSYQSYLEESRNSHHRMWYFWRGIVVTLGALLAITVFLLRVYSKVCKIQAIAIDYFVEKPQTKLVMNL